jgi:predicted NBD/HSP70 family sugar kinase
MHMLGLEVSDNGALAVSADENGHIVARGQSAGKDPIAAAFAALEKVWSVPAAPAVAAVNPESRACVAVMQALTERFRGSYGDERPVASGTAAVAAEAWIGAANGAKDVVLFAVGVHTSAGILRQGAPATGANGRAPAIAWLALNPVEREDYRKIGCLEVEVAAPGIVRRLIWRVKAGDRSRVLDAVGGDFAAISIEHVLAGARDGDGVAISVMRDTAKYLGMAAANLVAIADPEVLVLGGMMASAADLLLEPVRLELGRRLPELMREALTVVPASLGEDAPALGAARLASAARA